MSAATATVTVQLDGRTIDELREALAGWKVDIEVHSRAPILRDVIAYMGTRHDLTPAQITGNAQSPRLFAVRAAISWLAYRKLGRSYSQIGRAMGDRDHSTILNHVGRATSARGRDAAFTAILDDLFDHFGYGDAE